MTDTPQLDNYDFKQAQGTYRATALEDVEKFLRASRRE
jgi:hypothetical protein